MKHLYFIRHGLSEMNKVSVWTGESDSPLAPEGYEQAKKAGEKMKKEGLKFDLIISSPLHRAIETARVVAEEIGYPVDKIVTDRSIVERHFGELEGNKKLVAATKYLFDETAIDNYEGVEKLHELQTRADKFLEKLEARSEGTILVVGHGAFARALYRAVNKKPLHERGHRLDNAEMVQYI